MAHDRKELTCEISNPCHKLHITPVKSKLAYYPKLTCPTAAVDNRREFNNQVFFSYC